MSVVGELARADEALEHRGLRLLRLQEQDVVVVAADHEQDHRLRPDAADADDLARGVHVLELLDRMVVASERAPVRLEQPADRLLDLLARRAGPGEILDRDDQRRIGDDSQLAVDLAGPLRGDAQVVARACLRNVLGRLVRLPLAEPPRADLAPGSTP